MIPEGVILKLHLGREGGCFYAGNAMSDNSQQIGQVASVSGAVLRVRLDDKGASARIGRVGLSVRISVGEAQVYGICQQAGHDAAPEGLREKGEKGAMCHWLTVVLFGEEINGRFARGVGQSPAVGDVVCLASNEDMQRIYGWQEGRKGVVSVGEIAGAEDIPAQVDIGNLVSRHSVVVGSTGVGKSNLVTVLLESLAHKMFTSARTMVIDPHGEYAAALGDNARVFRIRPDLSKGERHLWVPFWALPFSELQSLALGDMTENQETALRDIILEMKKQSAEQLASSPQRDGMTADSPVPFSIKKLWFELDKFERITFTSSTPQHSGNATNALEPGDAQKLRPARYPAAHPMNQAPYKNAAKRNLERQIDLLRSRLLDARYKFLFSPGDGYEPDLEGRVEHDLDQLVSDWVGHDRPVTVFDMSGLPTDVLPIVVGTMLRVIYDMLFWSHDLPIGGRSQPLLTVIDEAHLFVTEGAESPAHRTLSMIAKEGRKYGVGLMLVTQRPSELDTTVLSQCGSVIALRMTNRADRAKVAAAVPDDLGGLVDQLPQLRTGEGVFLGEVMPIPSRVRIRKAADKPVGDSPLLPEAWMSEKRPDAADYERALIKWRAQSAQAEPGATPSEAPARTAPKPPPVKKAPPADRRSARPRGPVGEPGRDPRSVDPAEKGRRFAPERKPAGEAPLKKPPVQDEDDEIGLA